MKHQNDRNKLNHLFEHYPTNRSPRYYFSDRLQTAEQQGKPLQPENNDPDLLAPETAIELKLEDELAEEQLKDFAFGCIESLAQLSVSNANMTVLQAITELVRQKLPQLSNLTKELTQAQREHSQYRMWNKQLAYAVQPLINQPTVIPHLADQVEKLKSQVIQCAEQSIGAKYKLEALRQRILFLTNEIPIHVGNTAKGLCLPNKVIKQLVNCIRTVLETLQKVH